MWAESGQAVLGIERRIAMNKHDEQFAETIKSLKEHATCFDEYVSIQMLEELHEIHTSLDLIFYENSND
jgi:hypothetical protein